MIGRPDLQALQGAGHPAVLPAWFQPGVHVVAPDALDLAARPDGTPDLLLELARGADAMAGPAAHGTLDVRLAATCALDEALAGVRAEDPQATVTPAAFDAGWLWLIPGTVVPDELAAPSPLTGLGVGARRLTMRLSADTATLVRRMLVEDALAISAVAHLELAGIAPRLPVKVRFNPRVTRDALARLAVPGQQTVARNTLLQALRSDPRALDLEVLGDVGVEHRETLALTLADLLRAELARGAAGTPALGPGLAPLAAAELGAEPVERDLRTPFVSWRALVLRLHPLTALRDHQRAHGPGAFVTETVLPTLHTGMHRIDVVANLPAPRTGALSLGATLTAPPAPPHRPQAVVRSVELEAPGDRAAVTLALGPTEPLAYRVSASAVLQAAGAVARVEGPPRQADRAFLRLDVEDFPVRFVELAAAPGLLALARLEGEVRGTADSGPVSQPFALHAQQPSVAVALAADLRDAAIDVRARPLDADEPTLELAGLPAHDLRLDLHSFSGFGPHAVTVSCAFPDGRGECVVALVPEDAGTAGDKAGELRLTPQRPSATWTWFADSPFAPGYRFRRATDAAWSDPQPPTRPLALAAEAVPA